MNSTADSGSFFTCHTEMAVREAGIVHSRLFPIPVPFCLALINLDKLDRALREENTCDHLLALLSSREKELFSCFAYPKRRKEWLGGRLAAKYAVFQILHIEGTAETLPAFSILPGPNGSPRLTGPSASPDELPALSISHSGRFAVAMAAMAQSCGIDIQKISAQTVRVADRFCGPDELRLLRAHAPQCKEKELLTLLWSAKEALKKALLHDQPVIFQGVVLQSLTVDHHFRLHLRFPGDHGQSATVTAMMFADCILAHTLVRKSHA